MVPASVVMAVYNGARYLRCAVDSVLAQTLADFEFVIVDDGSTDETARILNGYADARIVRLRNETNIGLARSLNRGIAAARGMYIARQDADDVSYPARLATQARYLDAHPAVGAVGALTEWLDANGEILQTWRQPLTNDEIQYTLLRYCCLIHGSVMMRREAVSEAEGYDEGLRTGQDYDLWLRLSECWQIASVPEVLYGYRRHEGMASATRAGEQRRNAEAALTRAHARRAHWGWSALGARPRDMPPRFGRLSRGERAAKYVAWSAGAREGSRGRAALYLVFGALFLPWHPLLRRYVGGIGRRKLRLPRAREEFPAHRSASDGAR